MRNVRLRFSILIGVGLMFALSAASSSYAQDDNLFQYACAGNDPSLFFPHPSPAKIRVYQDGTTIFRQGDKFYAGKIAPKEVDELKRELREQSFLKQSRFVEYKDRSDRGLCFFRYLDAGEEIIVATEGIPKSGDWQNVANLVERYLPRNTGFFYPEKIEINFSRTTIFGDMCGPASKNKPKDWPFNQKLSLASGLGRLEVTDEEIIRYLFKDMYDTSLDWWWSFCENGGLYRIDLSTVPGWRLDEVNLRVGVAADNLRWDKQKQNK